MQKRGDQMPIIYLSPSTQEWNQYVTGGTEEYYMNLIADAMVPYLRSNGIQFTRNTPDIMTCTWLFIPMHHRNRWRGREEGRRYTMMRAAGGVGALQRSLRQT